MREVADFTVQETGGYSTVVVQGPLLISTVAQLDRDLRAYDSAVGQVDLSGVDAIDTVGAWTVLRFSEQHNAAIIGADNAAQRLIDTVKTAKNTSAISPQRMPLWKAVPYDVGQKMVELGVGAANVVSFLGAIVLAFFSTLIRPKQFRLRSFVHQMELVGVTSLSIIGLMSFLIGIVIAQQGAVQLAQFGAETLTVNLVGRITLRELGVLMTAIMVAGRSGSAFAAQLGTMKLTEEIDAMRTIGVSPMQALVLPRILAAVVMMPLLGFYASIMAILGGATVSEFMLGIPFLNFLSRIQEVVPPYDLWVGLIKAPVFGLIVALSGCYQGMQVKGNAEEVGLRTTRAVVQAIFAVIVLDAFFAVFFTEVGWA